MPMTVTLHLPFAIICVSSAPPEMMRSQRKQINPGIGRAMRCSLNGPASPRWSGKNGVPERITVDKSGANLAALEALNAGRPTPIKVRRNECLNNIVEQDDRAIKRIIRPMTGFKDFRRARIILSGIKVAHMIRKGPMQNDGSTKTAAEKCYSLVM